VAELRRVKASVSVLLRDDPVLRVDLPALHEQVALPSMGSGDCVGPCLVVNTGSIAVPHPVFPMQECLEAFVKVPNLVQFGWCLIVMALHRQWPELLVEWWQRVHVAFRHVLRVLLHTRGVACRFIRQLIARDTCVCFHVLEVNVVRAAAYDVDYAVNEGLVFAVLHACGSVQHVPYLVQHGCTVCRDCCAKATLECIPYGSALRSCDGVCDANTSWVKG
jgi:hypothetical protein